MIRKFLYNKFLRATGMLFLLLLLLLFPASKEYSLEDEQTQRVNKITYSNEAFLLDKNNYVSRCEINLSFLNKLDAAKKLVELLIKDGKYEQKIPNGFKAIIPSDTKINDISTLNDSITVDLSNDINELKDDDFKKMIWLLTYNLTTIKDIKKIYIKIDGNILEKFPSGNKLITQPFTRKDGVNEEYNEEYYKNVSKTTIYYVSKTNSNYYYVPVTKVNNDNREKIEIIVDELTSSNTYETNLMSFLNYNTKLNKYEISDNTITIDFNSFLFDDVDNKKILEEVIYTLSLSIKDNYDIEKVVFLVDGTEITKSVIKNIE